MTDNLDLQIEQANLRYRHTYVTSRVRGAPLYINQIDVDPDGEHLRAYVRTPAGSERWVDMRNLQLHNWSSNSVLWLPAMSGVLVWERPHMRQYKRGLCEQSMRIVVRQCRIGLNYWYEVVKAMRQPMFFDVGTAKDIMRDDMHMRAVAIGRNAYLDRENVVYYHSNRLGLLEDVQDTPLWRLINKENAA